MLRGDLIRHCGLEIGLDQTAASQEQLLMIDWANEGVRDVLLETRCRLVPKNLTLTAGQSDYSMFTLSPTIMAITDVFLTSSGQRWKFSRVSMDEILDYRRASSTANDRPRMYAAEGDLFAVYPTPAANDVVTVYAVEKPTAMDTDARDPATVTYGGIPEQYHHAILQYMLWRGARYDERRAPHTPKEYRDFYLQAVAEARRRIRGLGGRKHPGARVGYPDRFGGPTRNDTYPSR